MGRSSNLGDHAATLTYGTPGNMHGFDSYVLKTDSGDPAPVYSIASGLDYPSVGPEHAFWKDLGRVNYVSCTDEEAVDAFSSCRVTKASFRRSKARTRSPTR